MKNVDDQAGRGCKLLVLGGTGAVGRELVKQALMRDDVKEVIAPTRRSLEIHPKLVNPVFSSDLFSIPAESWQVDAVVCGIGSTIRKAGSREAFAVIDHDLPLEAARKARKAGAKAFGLVSSVGASMRGSFYLRTKARLENAISELGFPCVVIVRPSLIETDRDEFRPAEALGRWLSPVLNPLLPRQYRSISAQRIADALLENVLPAAPGFKVIESRDLHRSDDLP
ncbi:MAG: hypothetical protein RIQ81_906 [Pseudomonadota bacterium]|jgi:uncharacterized protein YbjT (DUF2867 family)